jgi:hypothetical protein
VPRGRHPLLPVPGVPGDERAQPRGRGMPGVLIDHTSLKPMTGDGLRPRALGPGERRRTV